MQPEMLSAEMLRCDSATVEDLVASVDAVRWHEGWRQCRGRTTSPAVSHIGAVRHLDIAAQIAPANMVPFQLILLGLAQLGLSSQTPAYPADGSDLFSFVSRPDIRAPRFNVSVYKPDQVTPGYWFTAPYGDLRSRLPTSLYQPGQVGPHIYDGNGDLVWSGAYLFDDRPTFDFKVANIDGAPHLTFITNEDLHETDSPGGSAIILDNSYRRVREVEDRAGRGTMNMHEYNTIDDGRRALTITFESKLADLTVDGEPQKMFIGNNGFSEVDVETAEPVFSWWALDHVDPSESLVELPSAPGSYGSPWDAYHINSVDKNQGGDYLISARYTSTIYKISGKDGHIIWRLGGSQSDFALQGFNMSSQHDARFQSDNETTVTITFFNNHSDGHHYSARTSVAVEVALDLETMTAHVVKQWDRPDGGLTKLRGNAQRLPNDNMFICWSENSYMSEHTADGVIVIEAQMASQRLVSYRAYKMNFTAQPSEPIAAKAFVFGVDEATSTTVAYVSWNGATEVAQWKLYDIEDGKQAHLATAKRTGFETMLISVGTGYEIMVEALDVHGQVLGKSDVVAAELPPSWTNGLPSTNAGHPEQSSNPHGPSSTASEEQMSVSEDLSALLHQAAHQAEDHQSSKGQLGVGGEALADPVLMVAIAAIIVFAAAIILLRRSRYRRRSGRPDLGAYKAIGDGV